MNRWLRVLIFSLSALLVVALALVGEIPAGLYTERPFYHQMMERLDSLDQGWGEVPARHSLEVGWSKTSLIPERPMPLAGYGARKPKTFESVGDSVFVRTIVLRAGSRCAAWISADLLVIHPEVSRRFFSMLGETGWKRDQIFFSATHTHSSVGAWAKGLIGKLFAGTYDDQAVQFLAQRLLISLQEAEENLRPGAFSYNELQAPELVRNRLVRDLGIIDPWLKVMGLRSGNQQGYASVYAAHATCLNHRYRSLSGDFPGYYNQAVPQLTEADWSFYAAGAVGSMGPQTSRAIDQETKAKIYASRLAENVALLELLAPQYVAEASISSFRVPLELPPAMMKINRSQGMRPWVFEQLTGSYASEIALLMVEDVMIVGLPCDFSGELAVPLYKYARDQGLHLVITSFNGGYEGYIIHDDWYDENLYESRVMSWHGPGMGSYFSEVITRLIDMAGNRRKG